MSGSRSSIKFAQATSASRFHASKEPVPDPPARLIKEADNDRHGKAKAHKVSLESHKATAKAHRGSAKSGAHKAKKRKR